MRARRAVAESSPSPDEVLLAAGHYLEGDALDRLRNDLATHLVEKLRDLLRDVQEVRLQLKKLGVAVPEVVSGSADFRESDSVPDIVRRYVDMHPEGIAAAPVIALVRSLKPDLKDIEGTVHTTLYRLSSPEGAPLEKVGQRGAYLYRPARLVGLEAPLE